MASGQHLEQSRSPPPPRPLPPALPKPWIDTDNKTFPWKRCPFLQEVLTELEDHFVCATNTHHNSFRGSWVRAGHEMAWPPEVPERGQCSSGPWTLPPCRYCGTGPTPIPSLKAGHLHITFHGTSARSTGHQQRNSIQMVPRHPHVLTLTTSAPRVQSWHLSWGSSCGWNGLCVSGWETQASVTGPGSTVDSRTLGPG